MENGTGQPKPPTADDHWPLDHHIEEVLDSFNHAARVRDSGPDDPEQRLEIGREDWELRPEIAVAELWAR